MIPLVCRDHYTLDDLIGGRTGSFCIAGLFPGQRQDCVLTNKRGQKLQCSHFLPQGVRGRDGRLPCVVYCHCNSGSRRDAEEAVYLLLPMGVSVFCMDFAVRGTCILTNTYFAVSCKCCNCFFEDILRRKCCGGRLTACFVHWMQCFASLISAAPGG